MTQSPGPEQAPVDDAAQPKPKPGRLRALGGNPRRKTLLLLAATAAGVLGVNQLLQSTGSSPADILAGKSGDGATYATYYLSLNGDDNADGLSPKTAWRTLTRVEEHHFLPGERLLLRGSDRFTGHLTFKAGSAGNADLPVRIGSYGTGRATLIGGNTPAISVFDTAGVAVSDMVLVGPGVSKSLTAGIDVYTDKATGDRLKGIWITNVDISGFRDGIAISGKAGAVGFQDVEVARSTLHDNRDTGLVSYGPDLNPAAPRYSVKDLRVSDVQAYDNLGNPKNVTTNSGSGILIGSVDGAVVENSVAHGNGARCKAPNGPVGIWAYDANNVVFRHNVSYANHSGGDADGGGFDLDRNTSNSLIEANLAYDNDGPGYLVYSAVKGQPSQHNTVRFNVSRDDSRKFNGYGQVDLSGWLDEIDVHNNTIAQSKTNTAALLKFGPHITNSSVRNNLLDSQGGAVIVAHQNYTTDELLLQGNDYWAPKSYWTVVWGTSTYTSLAPWRAATKEELHNGTGTATISDPQLTWSRPVSWAPTATMGPALPSGTNLDTAGLDLKTLFGIDPGSVDYFGSKVTSPTLIGATQP